jgi:hypothetical protein
MAAHPIQVIGGVIVGRVWMAAHRVRATMVAIAAIGSHLSSQPRKLRLLLQQRHDHRVAPNA